MDSKPPDLNFSIAEQAEPISLKTSQIDENSANLDGALVDFWQKFQEIIKKRTNLQSYKTWFEPIKPVELSNSRLTLHVPSRFFLDWLEEHYYSLINEALTQVHGHEVIVHYVIKEDERDANITEDLILSGEDGKRPNVYGLSSLSGSIREFFQQCIYVGVDIGPGKDVELVARGENHVCDDCSFDVVARCECFEHNPEWAKTFANMVRMSSGLVFFSCATLGRPEHGTPNTSPYDAPYCGEYYKNLTEGDVRSACDLSAFKEYGSA